MISKAHGISSALLGATPNDQSRHRICLNQDILGEWAEIDETHDVQTTMYEHQTASDCLVEQVSNKSARARFLY